MQASAQFGPAYGIGESLTVSTTAVALSTQSANHAVITVETAAVRFRVDGASPTATEGHELEPGDVLTLDSRDQIGKAMFIRRNGTDATLFCSYGA